VARVIRTDQGQLGKPMRTPQGLRVEGYASRPGVYEYTNTRADEKEGLGKAGTTRRELRPDDEQFAPEVLAGYEAAALTDGHPGKLIANDPALRAKYAKGVVLAARRDGDRIAITAMITDQKMVDAIESGKRELSPGYSIEIDRTAGVDPKYGRFDMIQRKLRIDHNAVVESARGGRDMAFRLDSDGETVTEDPGEAKCDYDLEGCDGGCMDWMPATAADGQSRGDAELTAEQRDNLKDSHFALPDQRKLPIHDEKHTRAAMGGHGLSAVTDVSDDDKKKAAKKIVKAAKKHGVDASGFAEKHGVPFEKPDDKPDEKRSDMADTKTEPTTIDELRKQRDDAKADASRLSAQIVALEGDIADLKKKFEGAPDLDKELKQANTRADEAIKERDALRDGYEQRVAAAGEIRAKAVMLLGRTSRFDGKTDDEVCLEVLRQLTPSEPYQTKDATWRRVRVDELAQRRGRAVEERAEISRAVRGDSEDRREERPAPKKPKHTDAWSAGPPATMAYNKAKES
jgi:hypothetical protein